MHIDDVLKPGTIVEDRYKILQPLDEQGSYGRTYIVESLRMDGRHDVLKVELPKHMTNWEKLSERARHGHEHLLPEDRANNDVRILNQFRGSILPFAADVISVLVDNHNLPGVVYSPFEERVSTLQQWIDNHYFSSSSWIEGRDSFALDSVEMHTMLDVLSMAAFVSRSLSYFRTGVMTELTGERIYQMDREFMHNDLKPGNILLSSQLNDMNEERLLAAKSSDSLSFERFFSVRGSSPIRVIDFGLSSTAYDSHPTPLELDIEAESKTWGVFGSESYSDPRTFIPYVSPFINVEDSDAWALENILFEILLGGPFGNYQFADAVKENWPNARKIHEATTDLYAERNNLIRDSLLGIRNTFFKSIIHSIWDDESDAENLCSFVDGSKPKTYKKRDEREGLGDKAYNLLRVNINRILSEELEARDLDDNPSGIGRSSPLIDSCVTSARLMKEYRPSFDHLWTTLLKNDSQALEQLRYLVEETYNQEGLTHRS